MSPILSIASQLPMHFLHPLRSASQDLRQDH